MERPIRPAVELMRAARDLVLNASGIVAFDEIYTSLRAQEGLADAPADVYRGALREAVAEAYWDLMSAGMLLPMEGLSWDAVNEGDRAVYVSGRVRKSSLALELQGAGRIALRNPDLFMRTVPALSDRVGRCLREAVDAYIRGLPLATVILLGAAVDGAWEELGRQLAPHLPPVKRVVDKPLHSTLELHNAVVAAGRRLGRRSGDWYLALTAAFVEFRNYAVHQEDAEPVDLTMAATMLYQVGPYLSDLNALALRVTRGVEEHTHTSDAPVAVVIRGEPD
jgi:hypothetical protein